MKQPHDTIDCRDAKKVTLFKDCLKCNRGRKCANWWSAMMPVKEVESVRSIGGAE